MMYSTQHRIKQTLPARALALLVFSAVLLVSIPVRATVILGNLPSNADSGSNPLSTTNHKAVSFNMGSADFLLDSVVLRLNRSAFGGGPTDPIMELRDDSSDPLIPGTTLFTFPNPIAPASNFNNEVFTPPLLFTLLADTTYWLVVRSGSLADDSNLLWSASNFPGITPTGVGATLGNYRSSSDGGANWNDSTFQNSFQINGTRIPEPGTLALFGLGLAGLGFARRKKA